MLSGFWTSNPSLCTPLGYVHLCVCVFSYSERFYIVLWFISLCCIIVTCFILYCGSYHCVAYTCTCWQSRRICCRWCTVWNISILLYFTSLYVSSVWVLLLQWRIYHWATWAMPPLELWKFFAYGKNATLEIREVRFWGKLLNCCHQMSYFKAKMHQI